MHMFSVKVYIFMCFHSLINACLVDFVNGTFLQGWTFKSRKKSSLYSCAADCVSYPICKSFNLDTRRKTCYLNTRNHILNLSDMKTDEKFLYSDINAWENIALGPCRESNCAITERCVVTRKKTVHCGEQKNVAKGKPATSSTMYEGVTFGPDVAVDGGSALDWQSGSCFASKTGDQDPWWQVDLLDQYVIVRVIITAREDARTERLHDFAIEVYKEDPVSQPQAEQQRCYMYAGFVTQAELMKNITCTSPVNGRYLRVSGSDRTGDDVLQFCEVEVHTDFPSVGPVS